MQRNILLCVTGLSPQVVTETVFALAVARTPRWIPGEIHVVTTLTGQREIELNLFETPQPDGTRGWFARLCADYALPPIIFGPSHIHVLRGPNGETLDDIRTPAENEIAADVIADLVRTLSQDDANTLHVSIAGGRKTMGYYIGYALSLYGRAQDRLSHVLVSEPFENNRAFYYPTPYRLPIPVRRAGREETFDARDARVELAEIPFVRLRGGLPRRLLDGRATLSQTVATANRAQAPALLELDPATQTARADGEIITLGAIPFALLWWLAERAQADAPPVDFGAAASADAFLGVLRRRLPPLSPERQRAEEALDWRRDASIRLAQYFEPHKTRFKQAFEDALGEAAARRYVIHRVRADDGGWRFYLPLVATQIRIAS